MTFLLGESPRAGDARQLAKRYGHWSLKRNELLWHPRHLADIAVADTDVLRGAQSRGRGVILSFNHHGWYIASFSALRARGTTVHLGAAPHFFDRTPGPGFRVRRDRRHLLDCALGSTVFDTAGSFPHIRDLLSRGEIVALAFDVPGPTATQVLGRTVYAAHGVARTADTTGALIVPVTMWDTGGPFGTARFEAPLDPSDYGSVADLHAAVVARHEPALLAWPEAVEAPLQRWGTEPPPVDPNAAKPRPATAP